MPAGYVGLYRVENLSTGKWQQSSAFGCPPPTTCTPPLTVKLGDQLQFVGYMRKCDQSAYLHDELGARFVQIKTGACGDLGEDLIIAGATTQKVLSGSYVNQSYFLVTYTVDSRIIDWITRQLSAGRRASSYVHVAVDMETFYSGEVRFDLPTPVEHTTPYVRLVGPAPLTEHTTPAVLLRGPIPPLPISDHFTPAIRLNGVAPPPPPPPSQFEFHISPTSGKPPLDVAVWGNSGAPYFFVRISINSTILKDIASLIDGSFSGTVNLDTRFYNGTYTFTCESWTLQKAYAQFTVTGNPKPPPTPTEHTTPSVRLSGAAPPPVPGEHTTPYVLLSGAPGPPGPPTLLNCEERFPGRNTPLSWDAIGYALCIVGQALLGAVTPFITAISTALGPIATAISNIKLEIPDWLTPFKEWLIDFPALVTSGLEWFTNPSKKIGELATAIVAEESPSVFTTIANILKAGYVQVPPKTPDWKLAPLTIWIEKTVHEWVQKWRARITELAIQYADDPATFSQKLTDEILYLETDAIATGMDIEMGSLGLLEGGARVIDVVLNYIGGGPTTHIFDKTAIDESIAITSQQYWANQFRKHLPGTGDVINQVVKEIIDLDEFKRLMGLQGFSETQAQRIWDAHFIAPARQELVTALRRGKISREAWNRLKILVDLDPRYDRINADTGEAGTGSFSIWNEMVYEDPGLSNLRFMYESGSVTDEQLPDYLKALGYRPEHIPALETYIKEYQSRFFRRRQLTLIARMVKAGKITEAEFIARAKAIYYTEKTARYELENQALASELSEGVGERTAQLGSINSWYIEGIIDAATYRDSAHTLLYSDDFIDNQLAYLDKRKADGGEPSEREATRSMWDSFYMVDLLSPDEYRAALTDLRYDSEVIGLQLELLDKRKTPPMPPPEPPPEPEKEREATRAMYDTYYMEDIIDVAGYRAALEQLRYPTHVIDLQITLLDKKKTPPIEPPPIEPPPELPEERDLLQSEALTAFKKRLIDETSLRDRLDKLGRSDDAINVLVAIAKADMATEQRDATLAVYAKAYRQGAILRSDYLAKLIDNQYTPDASELIVQTEELSWGTGIEALTAEQTLNAWEQGFLTIEQTTDRLRKAGWTDTDLRIRLSFSVIDMLKAKHLTTAEADKLWTDFGLGPEERARLAAWYGGTPA